MPKVIINDLEFEDLTLDDIHNFTDKEIADMAINHPDGSGKKGFFIHPDSELTQEQIAEYLVLLVIRLAAAT